MRYLFLQIICRLYNYVYKSQLASDMLNSCEQFRYRDYLSKYWQFYRYVSFKALLYGFSRVRTEFSTSFSLSLWWFPPIFPWVFPSKSVCFSLNLLFVNHMRYIQWPIVIVPCSWGSGGALSPQQFQGRGLTGSKGQKLWKLSTSYICQKCQKYTLVVHLPWIKISWILLINVIKSSTEVAIASIIASLSINLENEN